MQSRVRKGIARAGVGESERSAVVFAEGREGGGQCQLLGQRERYAVLAVVLDENRGSATAVSTQEDLDHMCVIAGGFRRTKTA